MCEFCPYKDKCAYGNDLNKGNLMGRDTWKKYNITATDPSQPDVPGLIFCSMYKLRKFCPVCKQEIKE